MLDAILGKKLVQTQMFTTDGKRIPVTDIVAGPCTVVQIKTLAHEGYWALQLGFDSRSSKTIGKPLSGHLKKAGQGNYLPRFLREVKFAPADNAEVPYKVGDQIGAAQVLKVGDRVQVTGISKAKGFQGGVKRHGFRGGPRTHGQSDRERAPGSIGQTTTPGRVYRGKRMAGRMGGARVTVKGLEVVGLDEKTNIVRIKGLVPGNLSGLILVSKNN